MMITYKFLNTFDTRVRTWLNLYSSKMIPLKSFIVSNTFESNQTFTQLKQTTILCFKLQSNLSCENKKNFSL